MYHAQGEPAICRDKETEPTLTPLAPGHTVACHFWSEIQAAGGVRAIPADSQTGAAVVESPFAEESVDGPGATALTGTDAGAAE